MKTKRKANRLLTMLLAFVMLVGLIPTTVFAGNTSTLELQSITITGVPMPQAGDKVSAYNEKKVESVSIATNPAGAVRDYYITWYNDKGNGIPTETFVAGTTYSYRVSVDMADGYCCTKPTEIDAKLNGKKPDEIFPFGQAWDGHTYNSFGVLNKYTIPVTPIEKTYDLTTSVNGGNGAISDSKTGLAENAEETVVFTPDTGYEIDNVTVNGVKATVTGNQLKVTMTENKTVVVTYKKTETQNPTTYTISFDMNDHGTQVDAQTVNEGAKATKPADPTAEGYNFKGWYADESLTNEFDFETAIKADTTVYAKWEKKADKPAEPSKPSEPTNPTTHDPGTEPETPENPVEPGTNPSDNPMTRELNVMTEGQNDSNTVAKGNEVIYIVDNSTKAVFRILGEDLGVEDLKSVLIDGKLVDASNYDVRKGSIIVSFKKSYVDFLSPGTHEITFNTTKGVAKAELVLKQKTQTSTNITKTSKAQPNTGDNGILYTYALELLMAASIMLILKARRNKNNLK